MVVDWGLFVTITGAVVAAKIIFAILSSAYSGLDNLLGWRTNMDNLRADNYQISFNVLRDELRDIKSAINEIDSKLASLDHS